MTIKQLTNKPISSLPTLNKRDARIDNISKEHIYNLGADKVILREINSISVNATKTLKRIIANFTEKNNIKNLKSNSVDYRVTMDIEEMAMDRGALSKKDLENSKRKSSILKDFRKKIKKDIATVLELIFSYFLNSYFILSETYCVLSSYYNTFRVK